MSAEVPSNGSSRRRLSSFILLPLVIVGCASPGTPRPPSLNVPEPASSLTADRMGGEVHLHWVTPGKTTDSLDTRGPVSASVCRRVLASHPPDETCAPVLKLPVAAGPSEAIDKLPPSLRTGGPSVLEYRIEILNASGRSAGRSASAFAASGAAPPDVRGMRAAASADGAVLAWSDEDARDAVELHRVKTPAPNAARTTPLGADQEPLELSLHVAPGGGALDRTATMGSRYTYTAKRVRRITVDGRALELRSLVSAPVSVEMRDVFPPEPPTGLEAVAGDVGVDLSWRVNAEPDLAGYFVFRRETGAPVQRETGVPVQLNDTPVPQPVYRDASAPSGHTFVYTVVAVDRAGNRSQPSGAVRVQLRTPFP